MEWREYVENLRNQNTMLLILDLISLENKKLTKPNSKFSNKTQFSIF